MSTILAGRAGCRDGSRAQIAAYHRRRHPVRQADYRKIVRR